MKYKKGGLSALVTPLLVLLLITVVAGAAAGAGDQVETERGITTDEMIINSSASTNNLEPGEKVWEWEAFGDGTSSPTVVDGTIYIGGEYHLHAVDAETGQKKWENPDAFDRVKYAPAVANGKVYFGTRSNAVDLVSLDAVTGFKEWEFYSDYVYTGSPTVYESSVYFRSFSFEPDRPEMYAFDGEYGSQQWLSTPRLDGSPTVVDNTVYVSGDSGLYALSVDNGVEKWVYETDKSVTSFPTVANNTVYVTVGDRLFAVDAETGTFEWLFDEMYSYTAGPTVYNGTVYIGGPSSLYAVDAETGEKEWEYTVDGPSYQSSPTVADGTVYYGAFNTLYAVDAESGEEEWKFTEPTGEISSSPTVVDGTVYFGDESGTLWAVNTEGVASSEGSRVTGGTLGHHDVWADKQDPNTNFTVDIFNVETAVEGETLNVTTKVWNVGDGDVTQNITLDVPGLGSNERELTLADSESTKLTLSVPTAKGDAGKYTVTVAGEDNQESEEATVLKQAQFVPSIVEIKTPLEGEKLNVTAAVQNTGDVEDTQTLELNIPELGSNQTEVTLSGNESTQETFTVDTQPGDNGTYTATLASKDAEDIRNVTVLQQSYFAVNVLDFEVNQSLLEVNYQVENVGDVGSTQTVTFSVSGNPEGQRQYTLSPGESGENSFSYEIVAGDAPELTAEIASENDTANLTVSVDPGELELTILETNSPVVEGEDLEVLVEGTNVGDEPLTESIELFDFNDTLVDDAQVELVGDNTAQETLVWTTDEGDAGSGDLTIDSETADPQTQSVEVLEQAEFEISILDTNEPAEGEDLSVTVEVSNTGGVGDTQTVTLNAGELGEDSTEVELDASASTVEGLSIATQEGDAGSYTAVAGTDDNEDSTEVTVLKAPEFDVTILNATTVQSTLNVTYQVENAGEVEGTQTLTFSIDGNPEDQRQHTLGQGESEENSFSYEIAAGDAPGLVTEVASENDSDDIAVTIAPAELELAVLETNSPVVEGEDLEVLVEGTNVGDEPLAESVELLDFDDTVVDDAQMELVGGSTTQEMLVWTTEADDVGIGDITVDSDTAEPQTQPVEVLEQAHFAVNLLNISEPLEGDDIEVEFEIQNTGDVEDTQTIELATQPDIGGNATEVTLENSESTIEMLSVATETGDADKYTLTIASEDDTDSADTAVLAPAFFELAVTDSNDPVEDESLAVTAEITNTGDVESTQTITLDAGALGENSTEVTLASDATTTETLTIPTEEGDAGAYSVTLESEDDSTVETVAVNEPAAFDVTITSVDSAVTAGEIVTVSYEVTNTGDVQATQDINFKINGTVNDTESGVTLNGSETFSGQFTYTTGSADTPTVDVTVVSNDDSASETVTVNDPAVFDVTITSVNSAATAGEIITTSYEVTNTGDVQATQDIEFTVNGTTEDTESGVTLNGSETFSGQFSYTTESADTPVVSVAVESEDDSASATVTVNDPAVFDVTITSVDSAVTAGEIVTASYEVTNTGDVQAPQDIEFTVNGTTEDSEVDVTLNGSETFSGQFTYTTGSADTPVVNVTVASEDDSASETVTVNDPAVFDVTITSVNSAVTAGEIITTSYEVTNTGDVQTTQDIEFTVNGTAESTDAGVTLNGSETVSGQFTYDTGSSDTPAVNVTVASNDNSAMETVTVNEPANFDVTIMSVDPTVTEGETITVAYEVTNTGDVQATQDIGFAVNGTAEDTASGVTLNGSETFSDQFNYDTVAGNAPAVSVAVSSADDSATETVMVDEPANFDVTLTSVDSAVTEGETVTVAYEVTNTGDVADTQDIGFAVNGTTEDTASGVTLNGSETFSGQFTYTTVVGDAPAVSVAVSSADDSATETVTVNEPSSFDVTITSVDSAVTEGETITVAYEVTNTGDAQDTQDITFAVNGTTEDTESGVTLNGSVTFSGQFSYATGAGDAPAVSVAVSSADDSASETVTVNEPASFDVTVTSIDSAVTEGETITVAYEVTNTGDQQGTQDITFAVNGTTEDTESGVTLNGSETFSGQFSYATGAGDAPAVNVAVSSADDSSSSTVTVNEPASFDVTLTSVDSAVTAGETITVAYEVTNTGDQQGTQDITFAVNGTTEDTESGVTLNGSETFSGQFTYDTVAGDAPAVNVAVSSADDSATQAVTVNEPASFDVTLTSVDSAVTEGETITVAYEVTNTGDQQGTQDITFAVNGTTEDTESGVTLNGSVTLSGQFTYDTVAGDAPAVSVAVLSADDSDSNTVTVSEPSSFVVDIVETNTPAEGEQLNITATIKNTGDVQDTQTVTLDVGPLGTDSTTVTLGGGASTNVTLSTGTGAGDAGEYTATVSSADDAASANVTVLAPAEFLIGIVETNTPVEGERLNVTAIIENTGDVQDSQEVTLDVGALGSDSTAVTLGGGALTNVTLSTGTGAGDAGEYTATVASADDAASANVTVLAPSGFQVDIVETNTPVEGESLNVTATIENTGDVQDTQTVTLDVGPLGSNSTTVTLGGGASTDLTLSAGTGAGDAGEYTATVSSADDFASANVTVLAPAEFTVNIVETTTPVEGESLSFTANIQNIGDLEDTQEINLSVGALGTDSVAVTLAGGASTNETLSVSTAAGDAGGYTATVSSADDAASANVTVLTPSGFQVDIVETNAPVEGESLNVTATIENTGDVEGTQTIDLTAGSLGTDSTTVTLSGGASTNVTLSVGTGAGDAGEYTATVSSANETTSANVTVLTPAQFVVSNLTAPAETTVGASINVSAAVTNIGGTDGLQAVAFQFDEQTVANRTVSLTPDASTTVTFSATVPDQTGTFEHGVFTDDDNRTAEIAVVEPGPPNVTMSNLSIAGQGNNPTVIAGSYDVSVELSHDGGPNGTVPMELTIGNATTNETVSLNASESKTVTFENAIGGLSPAVYNVTVSAGNASMTGEVTLSVALGDGEPATDTTGDGLLNDADGDGVFDIFDVQTFFESFNAEAVQTNPGLFDFDDDGTVDIFDVQALFEQLS